MEPNNDISPIKKNKLDYLNDSTAHKEANEDRDNSHDSTEGYMSYIGKIEDSSPLLTGNELMNYMINSLNSTNTHMQHKLRDSINLGLFDHLNQIKANLVNRKQEEPLKDKEKEKEERNPYVYPNDYNLLTTQGRYEIFAEIRDRTDERTQKFQEVLETMYQKLALFNGKSPYMNMISEQRDKFKSLKRKSDNQVTFEGKLTTTEGITDNCFTVGNYISSPAMNSSTDFGDYQQRKVIEKEGDVITNDSPNPNNESFNHPEQQEMLKKSLNDKNSANNIFQSSTSSESNGRIANDYKKIEEETSRDNNNYRNQSTGEFSARKMKAGNEKEGNDPAFSMIMKNSNGNNRQQLLYSEKKQTKKHIGESYRDNRSGSMKRYDIKKVVSK